MNTEKLLQFGREFFDIDALENQIKEDKSTPQPLREDIFFNGHLIPEGTLFQITTLQE